MTTAVQTERTPDAVIGVSTRPSERFHRAETSRIASVSAIVSSTSLEQGVINAGNEKLVPERDWVFEGALEHHLLGDGAIGGAADRLGWCSRLESSGSVDRRGRSARHGPARLVSLR